jgi:WD40-like Beta Propeller Repeat
MDKSVPHPPDDDFEVEVSATQRLGHETPRRARWGWWWSADLTPGQSLSLPQRRWRQLTAVGAVLLALAIIAASVWGNPLPQVLGSIGRLFAPRHSTTTVMRVVISSTASTAAPTPLPEQDGVSCLLTDPAWSPDGTRIAVVGGSQLDCLTPQNRYEPALLNLYDGRSGALVRQVQPDAAVLEALQLGTTSGSFATPTAPSGASEPSALAYWRLIWSPDGRRLALAFFVGDSSQPQPIGSGLLLLDADGGHPRVLLQPKPTAWGVPQEWDLVRGVPPPIASTSTAGALPAALAYRWGVDGALVPQGVLSQDRVLPPPPLASVGNPDGGARFTLWQPGQVFRADNTAAQASAVYGFATGFAAWSPDGRYLFVGNELGFLVPVGQPPPNRQDLDTRDYGDLPFVPMRDSALQVASSNLPTPIVAWRPDGRVLAAYASQGSEGSGNAVILYNCATGQRLATLALPTTPVSLVGIEAALRWSPDGSRLLLSSAEWGLAVLWGPDQLQLPGIG